VVARKCRRYAFHMKNSMPTIEGLLVKRLKDRFVLINAQIIQSEDRSHDMAGHVEVLRENVYVLQEIQ
jgi:hypothetical protein